MGWQIVWGYEYTNTMYSLANVYYIACLRGSMIIRTQCCYSSGHMDSPGWWSREPLLARWRWKVPRDVDHKEHKFVIQWILQYPWVLSGKVKGLWGYWQANAPISSMVDVSINRIPHVQLLSMGSVFTFCDSVARVYLFTPVDVSSGIELRDAMQGHSRLYFERTLAAMPYPLVPRSDWLRKSKWIWSTFWATCDWFQGRVLSATRRKTAL